MEDYYDQKAKIVPIYESDDSESVVLGTSEKCHLIEDLTGRDVTYFDSIRFCVKIKGKHYGVLRFDFSSNHNDDSITRFFHKVQGSCWYAEQKVFGTRVRNFEIYSLDNEDITIQNILVLGVR